MTNFNNVSMVAGHLVDDPKLTNIKTDRGDFSILDMVIAVNPESTNKNAKADFIRTKMYGVMADTAAKYLKKGAGVGVVGTLTTGKGPYKDTNGVTQYPVNVDVDNIDFSRDLNLNLNQQFLTGHLTNDPELRCTKSGIAVARFSIGVNRIVKKDEESKSDFFQAIAYGKEAEFIAKYFTKGMKININGRIATNNYKNKDGFTVYTTEIVVNKAKFAKKKAGDTSVQQVATEPIPQAEVTNVEQGMPDDAYYESFENYIPEMPEMPEGFEPSNVDSDSLPF